MPPPLPNGTDPGEFFLSYTFHYHPSVTLAWIALGLYLAVTIWSLFLTYKYGGLFMYIVPAMGLAEVLGYTFRLLVEQQKTLLLFIITTLFILMTPIALALVNYICVGKLLEVTKKNVKVYRFNIRPSQIAKIFFWSDVLCFCVQGGGGGILAIGKAETTQLGNAIVLLGLCIQLLFFFTFIYILYKVTTDPYFGLKSVPSLQPVFRGLKITVVLLLIRNIFRVIEFASSPTGPAYTTEWAFYVFETLPIVLSFVFYCFYHFGRLLESRSPNPTWITEYRELAEKEPEKENDGGAVTPAEEESEPGKASEESEPGKVSEAEKV